MERPPASQKWLLSRVESRVCALPLSSVVETMRALPIDPLPRAPDFVLGVTVVRGSAMPAVDAARLLGSNEGRLRPYFIVVRAGARSSVLAVDEVLGVRSLAHESIAAMPPLLVEALAEAVAMLGAVDDRLLFVLESSRLVPESLWRELDDRVHSERR